MSSPSPLLYSFRRCPYAMRARLALHVAAINIWVHEVDLKQKPEAMLHISPKGTVPVLCLQNGTIIEESLDIMRWALAQYDPQHWLDADITDMHSLIQENDTSFKYWLDRYKYAVRFPEYSMAYYRQQGGKFLNTLNQRLAAQTYLFHHQPRWADMAIFPFVRQFAFVDQAWFAQAYPALNQWLHSLIEQPMFQHIMQKHAANQVYPL